MTDTFLSRPLLLPCLLGATLALAGCGGSSNNPPPVAKGDPLYEFQWHLKNTGQTSFSSAAGIPGFDLNVESLFNAGSHGRGVKVLVLDDGIDIRHEDLAANVDHTMLQNFDPKAKDVNDPMPLSSYDSHGIAVAGIIGAAADNGLGGRGVAPGIALGSINFLCSECMTTEKTILAYGGAPYSAGAWVINASYGQNPTAPIPVDIDTDAKMRAIRGFANMRDGKGIVMVKSAGNEFLRIGPEDGGFEEDQCGPARQHGLSCENPAFDEESVMPQVVTVAAVNARGVKSSYSSAGSSILVSGLGGESGYAAPKNPYEAGPAIITTDLPGCDRGESRRNPRDPHDNDFENPDSEIGKKYNADCNYTSLMGGTSSAAPTVTGGVALMLEANPKLTWRDLRLILAKTSRKIDENHQPIRLALSGGTYVAEPGWTKNAAGLWFHNWYGYGLVDAAAAVAMAKSYGSYLPGGQQLDSGWLDSNSGRTVPVGDPNGLTNSIAFADKRTIEAVQIRVTFDGDAILGDLGIELISPSGTRSVLMTAHNVFQASETVVDLPLMSNAFNEEPAAGIWTLRVVDVNGRQDATRQAYLRSWSLRVLGR